MKPAAGDTISIGGLFLLFARVGSLAWGGGGATLAMMHQEFCVRRSLIVDEEFQVLFALSRLVPGMNLLSLTVLLGHRSHGFAGALVSLAGLTLPSFTLIVLLCGVLQGGRSLPALSGAVRALGAAVVALLLHTVWQLAVTPLSRLSRPLAVAGTLLAVAAAALSFLPVLSPAWIVVGGGALGALVGGRLERKP
jgi:chromate transporter